MISSHISAVNNALHWLMCSIIICIIIWTKIQFVLITCVLVLLFLTYSKLLITLYTFGCNGSNAYSKLHNNFGNTLPHSIIVSFDAICNRDLATKLERVFNDADGQSSHAYFWLSEAQNVYCIGVWFLPHCAQEAVPSAPPRKVTPLIGEYFLHLL